MDCAGDRANGQRHDSAVLPASGGDGDRCALVMLLTTTVMNQAINFMNYGVSSLVTLALPDIADEDVFDEWSELEAVVSPQSSIVTPPTQLTNATCPAFEDGPSGNVSAVCHRFYATHFLATSSGRGFALKRYSSAELRTRAPRATPSHLPHYRRRNLWRTCYRHCIESTAFSHTLGQKIAWWASSWHFLESTVPQQAVHLHASGLVSMNLCVKIRSDSPSRPLNLALSKNKLWSIASHTLCSAIWRRRRSFTGVMDLSPWRSSVTRLFNLIGGCYIQTRAPFYVRPVPLELARPSLSCCRAVPSSAGIPLLVPAFCLIGNASCKRPIIVARTLRQCFSVSFHYDR
ncbi:hypothetical protein MRX96_014767 [Rhipicephalus microplus]